MTSKASKAPSEADIVFNRANIALARSQRLIESWLGPAAESDSIAQKTEAELEREDAELFKAEPETLGVGAKVNEDELDMFGLRRKNTAANDQLLEQILGKKAAKGHKASKARPDSKTGPEQALKTKDSRSVVTAMDSDDEEGRAGMFKSKAKAGSKRKLPDVSSKAGGHQSSGSEEETRAGAKASKGAGTGSYLDQLLADKAQKKKKKT